MEQDFSLAPSAEFQMVNFPFPNQQFLLLLSWHIHIALVACINLLRGSILGAICIKQKQIFWNFIHLKKNCCRGSGIQHPWPKRGEEHLSPLQPSRNLESHRVESYGLHLQSWASKGWFILAASDTLLARDESSPDFLPFFPPTRKWYLASAELAGSCSEVRWILPRQCSGLSSLVFH